MWVARWIFNDFNHAYWSWQVEFAEDLHFVIHKSPYLKLVFLTDSDKTLLLLELMDMVDLLFMDTETGVNVLNVINFDKDYRAFAQSHDQKVLILAFVIITIRTDALQLLHWLRHTRARWTCNDLILTLLNCSLLSIWCWGIVFEVFSEDFTVDSWGCNRTQSQRGNSLSQWFLLIILQLLWILKLFKSSCFTPIYFVNAKSARL